MPGESISNKTARTSFWAIVEKVSTMGVQFVITMILARLLTPSDYGTIAMLTVFISLSQAFVYCGVQNALIRKQDCSNLDYCTAFFINVSIACFVYLLLFLLSPQIASFYDTPSLSIIIRVYGLSILVNSLMIVQYALLIKRLEFKKLAKFSSLIALLSGLFAVIAAYKGIGVWALVLQNLISCILTVVCYFYVIRWKPSFVFSVKSAKYLWGFGSKMLLSDIISTIYSNIYSLVIGKFYDKASLGVFNRGQHISNLVPEVISSAFIRNSLPIMSEVQNDKERLKSVYRQFIVLTFITTMPLVMLVAVIARPFVLFCLTEKWEECIIYIQIFCLSSITASSNWVNLNLLQACGRSDLTLKAEIIKKSIGLSMVFILLPFSPLVLAIGSSMFNLFVYIVNLYYAKKMIGLTYKEQLIDIYPIIVSTMISSCISYIWILYCDLGYILQIMIASFTHVILFYLLTRYCFKISIYSKIGSLNVLSKWKK